MFSITREQLVELVGEEAVMASTAIMPAGYWHLLAHGRWEFVPEEE